MRRHEIESWALNVIDRARLRQPVEDSRVELKAQWPTDHKKAARRIAAHANSAGGEPILWIIGIDEGKGQVLGAAVSEFASWYSKVRAEFDELAPEPLSLNIPVNAVTVTALFFETDAAPFVIKNSEGGAVQREVPWREATGVRSATRAQLLRLLSPLQKVPQIEIVACNVKLSSWRADNDDEYMKWTLNLALFLTQPSNQESIFPSHRSEVNFEIPAQGSWGIEGNVKFYDGGAKNINATDSFISIRSSGLFDSACDPSFKLTGALELILDDDVFAEGISVSQTLYSVTADRHFRLSLELPQSKVTTGERQFWTNRRYPFEQIRYR
jgi:hypothetical protein